MCLQANLFMKTILIINIYENIKILETDKNLYISIKI